MQKIVKTNIGKFSHFFPCQATIVTSRFQGKDNAMAVAWHMPVSAEPPLYGVGIAPGKHSHRMISGSGQFGVNFMPFSAAELVACTGGPSGENVDKFRLFKLEKEKALVTEVPILAAAYTAFECIVEDSKIYGDHTLFIGRVVAVHQAPDAYTEKGQLNLDKVKPVLYMGSDRYLYITSHRIECIDRKATTERFLKEDADNG